MMPAVCTHMRLCILAGMTWCLPLHSLPGAVEAFHDIIPTASCRDTEACLKRWRLACLHRSWQACHSIHSGQTQWDCSCEPGKRVMHSPSVIHCMWVG